MAASQHFDTFGVSLAHPTLTKSGSAFIQNIHSEQGHVMPWEKSFDRRKALEASMRVFWAKGYERTSYADIVKATKASRYGLYDEFGDKHDMYLAALDQYRDGPVNWLIGDLDRPDAGLTQLRSYFARMVDAFRSGEAQKGCLMSLSAIDLAPHDPEVSERVQKNFIRMRTLYAHALSNAQVAGDWPSDRSAQDTAAALFGIVQGAAIFQRGGEPVGSVADYVEKSADLLL